jgi:hypothetical protein
LTLLEARGLAFERYMEARMEFLELRMDRCNPPAISPSNDETRSVIDAWFVPYRRFLPIALAGMLGIAVFALAVERRQVHDLEAARDELRVSLDQTRAGLQALAKKPDVPGDAKSPVLGQTERTPAVPAVAPQPAQRKPPSTPHWRRVSGRERSQKPGAHRYQSFSLARSRQFKRVGPIELSLRSVDVERNSVSLSIVSDTGKVNMEHLKPNQPIWVKAGQRGRQLELVVDRIAKNGLYGHLVELGG